MVEGLRAVTAVDIDFVPHNFDTSASLNFIAMNITCDGAKRKWIHVRLLLSRDQYSQTT